MTMVKDFYKDGPCPCQSSTPKREWIESQAPEVLVQVESYSQPLLLLLRLRIQPPSFADGGSAGHALPNREYVDSMR